MTLNFDEPNHVYSLNGIKVPSVTQILSPISKTIYEEINIQTLMAKAYLGSKVHKLIERHLKYNFAKPSDLTEDYFEQYLLFEENLAKNYKVENLHNEFKGFYKSDNMTFAGTIDNIRKIGDEIWLIDWKTVANPIDLLLALQLYGYKLIAEQRLNIKIDRVGAVIINKSSNMLIDLTNNINTNEVKNLFIILYKLYIVLNNQELLKLKSKINFEEKI